MNQGSANQACAKFEAPSVSSFDRAQFLRCEVPALVVCCQRGEMRMTSHSGGQPRSNLDMPIVGRHSSRTYLRRRATALDVFKRSCHFQLLPNCQSRQDGGRARDPLRRFLRAEPLRWRFPKLLIFEADTVHPRSSTSFTDVHPRSSTDVHPRAAGDVG